MLKSKSESWQLAKRLSRRKYCNWFPVCLDDVGNVTVQSVIRGNTWECSLQDLKLLAKSKGLK